MSLTRIHNFSISLDGFGTGEPQSADAPFGHAGERLHEWMFRTRFWHVGGTAGVDDAFAQRHSYGIGAEIMGANKFGPPGWQDDPDWKGWWGPNPPFHTPTFVLTHRPRPSIEMEGGTTFHFLNVAPVEALAAVREAANGQDVRIGGGASLWRGRKSTGQGDEPFGCSRSFAWASVRVRGQGGAPGAQRGRTTLTPVRSGADFGRRERPRPCGLCSPENQGIWRRRVWSGPGFSRGSDRCCLVRRHDDRSGGLTRMGVAQPRRSIGGRPPRGEVAAPR